MLLQLSAGSDRVSTGNEGRQRRRAGGTQVAELMRMDPIRAQLAADHRVLDDLFCRLLRDVRVLSQQDLQTAWCELEHRLLSHMDVEEQFLFPLADAGHRAAVKAAQDEHLRIRGLVCELGVAIELHTVGEPAIKDLIAVLHRHAEREDALLYRFACERASASVQYRMATTLRIAARTAHEAALKTTANRSGSHVAAPADATGSDISATTVGAR